MSVNLLSIRSGNGRIDAADPSIAALAGSIEVRFADSKSCEIGVWVVVVSGAVVETMLDTGIPSAAQLLSPQNFINNGATAAAIAYDFSGTYVETDH